MITNHIPQRAKVLRIVGSVEETNEIIIKRTVTDHKTQKRQATQQRRRKFRQAA